MMVRVSSFRNSVCGAGSSGSSQVGRMVGQCFESIGRIARSSPASSFFGTHLFTLGPPACLLEVRRLFLRLRPIGLALRGGLLDLAFGRSPQLWPYYNSAP